MMPDTVDPILLRQVLRYLELYPNTIDTSEWCLKRLCKCQSSQQDAEIVTDDIDNGLYLERSK